MLVLQLQERSDGWVGGGCRSDGVIGGRQVGDFNRRAVDAARKGKQFVSRKISQTTKNIKKEQEKQQEAEEQVAGPTPTTKARCHGG